ncbi:MAG: acetate/propionate family kinase [Chlorobi bacterium]|nr:acetate/propionate family kinase [Chlorobiota bacterium]
MKDSGRILAVNSGSSSIKFALCGPDGGDVPLLEGTLERIGSGQARFAVTGGNGELLAEEPVVAAAGHETACAHVFSWLRSHAPEEPDAIGHRIVHGGPYHTASEALTPELFDSIQALSPFAPEHLPGALHAVRRASVVFPDCPQVLCFDTAFHHTLPAAATTYPLPEFVRSQGVRRYGFHGLSYAWLLGELERREGNDAVQGRIILAHLGHGASMAAVRNGRSIETSMGFSPAGGLVMSTRSGDLDPGVLFFLLEQRGMSPSGLKEMVNRRSGLAGLSGKSGDMRDLLAASPHDPCSALAVELFCYQAKKYIGALSAVLGGLDMLVFTGGIGQHAPEVRRRICEEMEFLGISLDPAANDMNLEEISHRDGAVSVRVMKTNEELMIVRETRRVLAADG